MSLLDLTMTPNRSFDRRHARCLIVAVGAVFLLGGLRLVVLGAWPVVPFMVIDVGLLSWAFRASYRSGRAFERLELTSDTSTLRHVDAAGGERRVDLDPAAARARIEYISGLGNRLWLESHGKSISVGSFLSPAERTDIHALILAGLAHVRRYRR